MGTFRSFARAPGGVFRSHGMLGGDPGRQLSPTHSRGAQRYARPAVWERDGERVTHWLPCHGSTAGLLSA